MGVSILPPLESWDYPYGAHCVRIRTCTGSLGLEAGYQRLCRSKYVASQGYAENTNTPSDLFPTADPVLPGFPADNIQVFELYNSQSQIQARTHPALVETQRFLLSLWHTSDPSTEISLNTPISYFDRLRIRQPGDSKFTLGPHIDGGSVERWEDPGYRACFGKILEGGSSWREHDPFDVSPRIHAQQDLYHASYVATSHTRPSNLNIPILGTNVPSSGHGKDGHPSRAQARMRAHSGSSPFSPSPHHTRSCAHFSAPGLQALLRSHLRTGR